MTVDRLDSCPDSDKVLSHWTQKLANLTQLTLPTDYPRSTNTIEAECIRDLSNKTCSSVLNLCMNQGGGNNADDSESDEEQASVEGFSPFHVVLSAFSILLHRHTGESDLAIGSSVANNPLLLRFKLQEAGNFQSVLNLISETEKEATTHAIPYDVLIDHLNKSLPEPVLVRVRVYNLTDASPETLGESHRASGGGEITLFVSQQSTVRRLLPIQIRVVYNASLFSENRIIDMLDQVEMILQSAYKKPQLDISKISLVTKHASSVLPDPVSNLAWDKFEGAITDIFAKNAESFPDRTCVIENRLDSSVVQYTYQQIHYASNVLAHYLIANGVEREDVVVLYSYRGVDLVVAIMGVLKAGATFSVIDPAYPPSRQTVYLGVAQPRALVILEKAGQLQEPVKQYIDAHLNLKTTVPALLIKEDGTLLGGKSDESHNDIFDSFQNSRSKMPGVSIGPDSIGTLSFTSGSTGVPKGVRGRHFSLTHFYPWMSQEFQLSELDRFTMLSGIAHDPIQRDVFTPLFLGACLCVPTADDIGTPGRLAEWMDENKVTITHLTPAMGQLLSANASHPIPSLRHAFFVGDVLTKRDVLRLQHLAPHTHVINMYGTTETQRAVSYLSIPPISTNPGFLTEQKDIMPAGKGMKNVQLLVLNKSGLQCGIGEMGELYVRSGGLAEGYLALPDVTKTKFILNPFNPSGPAITEAGKALPHYHGPRDRMYRTGDLGRYRADGLVECSGRADDQVKIRGFRIELGEIDTYMSQHPNIRENVTLVRRDKYEEMTLVSYFVPLDPNIDDMNEFVKDLRAYLREKLPSYAVPSVYVPLSRMPLTPNGKVDKNALPFPDTALAAAALPPSTAESPSEADPNHGLNPLQVSVRQIWSQLLSVPITSITLLDSFFDLGGHSILATRLVFEIRKTLAVNVPLGMVYRAPTLKGMCKEIDSIRGDDLNLAGGAILNDENALDGTLQVGSESKTSRRPSLSKRTSTESIIPQDTEFDYAADLDVIDSDDLSGSAFPDFKLSNVINKSKLHFFVTGVTGFLGAFIVHSLLERFDDSIVYCLVRSKSGTMEDGFSRISDNLKAHLVWNSEWEKEGRVQAVIGDLAQPKFGVADSLWNELAEKIDIIIHNGALVHWVYPYNKLRQPNVIGTKTGLELATTKKLKPFHFVSSTSVLDTEHYVRKLDVGHAVMEDDDLEGSRKGLKSGYGQSKWVAEKLVMRCRERQVPATIIRPGYIVGDARTGVSNTDDFLWRLVKGCVQLGKVPRIANIVNMCSVDYVAGCIAEIVGHSDSIKRGIFHIWNSGRFRFDDMFSSLAKHQYAVEPTEYIHWRTSLMEFTMARSDSALYPLLHFVLDDLPTSTKSPELDDANTRAIIEHSTVRNADMKLLMDLYLGYLVFVDFLEPPPSSVTVSVKSSPSRPSLPRLAIWEKIKGRSMIARSGN